MHKTKGTLIYKNREGCQWRESSAYSSPLPPQHYFPLAQRISLKIEIPVIWLCCFCLRQVLTVLFSVQQNVAIQRRCKAYSCSALVQDPLTGASLLQSLLPLPKPCSAELQSASLLFMQKRKCYAMLPSGKGAKSIPTTGMNLVEVLKIKMNICSSS